MKSLLKTVFILSFTALCAQNKDTSQALNLVSKETMLIERMAKDRIYLNNGIQVPKATKELNSSIILFERNIEILVIQLM